MIVERTHEGWTARLRPRGAGRFGGAAFLAFWLVGWAIGEVVALGILLAGARRLLGGRPLTNDGEPMTLEGAMLAGGFLLVWLTFWTIGGWAAWRELLRLTWFEQLFRVGPEGLFTVDKLGPFRKRRHLPRGAPLRLYLLARPGALMADAGGERIELTRLGTPAEREQLRQSILAEMGIPDDPEEEAAALPSGWEELIDPEGGRVLVKELDGRRKMARVLALPMMLAALAAAALAFRAKADPAALVPALMAATLAIGFAALEWRLVNTRPEWRVDPGRLVLRRRGPRGGRDLFDGASLELTESRDDDGDSWYALEALASTGGKRKTIHREMHDAGPVRSLGLWLARETQLPFADRTTPEARAATLREMTEKLRVSGRLGRWVADRLARRGGETSP